MNIDTIVFDNSLYRRKRVKSTIFLSLSLGEKTCKSYCLLAIICYEEKLSTPRLDLLLNSLLHSEFGS